MTEWFVGQLNESFFWVESLQWFIWNDSQLWSVPRIDMNCSKEPIRRKVSRILQTRQITSPPYFTSVHLGVLNKHRRSHFILYRLILYTCVIKVNKSKTVWIKVTLQKTKALLYSSFSEPQVLGLYYLFVHVLVVYIIL